MSILDMSLGLPADIDAVVSHINDGADALDRICSTMYGRAHDVDGQFNDAAGQFSDLIAWDISSASARELQSWQDAGSALTSGAAVLRLWADDIEEYRATRADLHERWETAKRNAQSRVDNPVASAAASGRTGGLVEGIVDAAANNKAERESQEVMALNGFACELIVEHTTAWDLLMDQADQVKKDLRNGPSQETVGRLVEAGHVGWNHVGFFFPVSDVPIEEFSENASPGAVSSWWESLTEDEQQEAREEYPDDLRNLNGIPVTVRDELNRAALDEHMEFMEARDADVAEIYLEDVRAALEADDKFLIHFDPLAGGGEVAISTGNPDTADNVSTLVPGMFTHAGSLGLSIERSETIHGQMNEHAPGADNASVMWFGYDPPSPGDWSADEAGRDLAEFQAGLRATHQGDEPSYNSVLGHSFGSFVVGAADNPGIGGGLDADSMVLAGGAGASVDNITELAMDPEDIHIIAGDDDWINDARDLGLDGHFGAPLHSEEFRADPENPGETLGNLLDPDEETGHSGYFEDAQTLDYLGDLMTGN